MNQINKKIFASIILCMILISTCSNTIFALTELTEGYIQKREHLTKKGALERFYNKKLT